MPSHAGFTPDSGVEHPHRRASDRQPGLTKVRDRLVSMLLLAGLLHGLVILGVSFAPGAAPGRSDAGMEVLLVSDELPEAERNDDATYLSQRTQTGSGNTQERKAARLPGAAAAGGGAQTAATATEPDSPEDQVLATAAPRARLVYQPPASQLPQPPQDRVLELPLLLGEGAGQAEQRQDPASDLVLRGQKRDELYVTADTRASKLAPYLDGWKRRVERIGTINYPSAAQRRGLTGNPVVAVQIRADGRLDSATILKSSGYPEIDAATLQILRLASPFDPFPPDLASDYNVLRFAYEWQFVGGRVAQGNLSVP